MKQAAAIKARLRRKCGCEDLFVIVWRYRKGSVSPTSASHRCRWKRPQIWRAL